MAIRRRPCGHPETTVWPSGDDRVAIRGRPCGQSPQFRPVPHGGQAQCSNSHGRTEQCGSQRFFKRFAISIVLSASYTCGTCTTCCTTWDIDLPLRNLNSFLQSLMRRQATAEPVEYARVSVQKNHVHLSAQQQASQQTCLVSTQSGPWDPVVAQQRRNVDESVEELQLRNLNGFQHSKAMGTCRRTTNKDVNNLVQETHLWNLYGSLHSQDHGHLLLQQFCPISAPVESPRTSARSGPGEPHQRACQQTYPRTTPVETPGLLHGQDQRNLSVESQVFCTVKTMDTSRCTTTGTSTPVSIRRRLRAIRRRPAVGIPTIRR